MEEITGTTDIVVFRGVSRSDGTHIYHCMHAQSLYEALKYRLELPQTRDEITLADANRIARMLGHEAIASRKPDDPLRLIRIAQARRVRENRQSVTH